MEFISESSYWLIAGFFMAVGGFLGLSVSIIIVDFVENLLRGSNYGKVG